MRLSRNAAAAAALAIVIASSTGQAQEKPREVSADGFPISFDADVLPEPLRSSLARGATKRFKQRGSDATAYIMERSSGTRDEVSRMTLVLLDPGYHYEYNHSVKASLERNDHFKKNNGRILDNGAIATARGSVKYAVYEIGGVHCVQYARVFGQSGGDNYGEGDKRFTGAHCRVGGAAVDKTLVPTIASAWSFEK